MTSHKRRLAWACEIIEEVERHGVPTLVQNEELATMRLQILVTTGFSSDLLLNMSNFE